MRRQDSLRYFPLITVIFRSAVNNSAARECGTQRRQLNIYAAITA